MSFKRISVEEAKEIITTKEVTIADVRDPGAFQSGSIENAINVSDANVHEVIATANKKQPVIVYCYHGNMSQGAADYFANNGCGEVYSVDGGYEEWRTKL